mmetsp:Transcript_42127/g.74109  ORF Transcript_42127/g.74109 Transcript_42127/m.74109 type:complete len:286 (-) Transcript_42127:220-1077(-)
MRRRRQSKVLDLKLAQRWPPVVPDNGNLEFKGVFVHIDGRIMVSRPVRGSFDMRLGGVEPKRKVQVNGKMKDRGRVVAEATGHPGRRHLKRQLPLHASREALLDRLSDARMAFVGSRLDVPVGSFRDVVLVVSRLRWHFLVLVLRVESHRRRDVLRRVHEMLDGAILVVVVNNSWHHAARQPFDEPSAADFRGVWKDNWGERVDGARQLILDLFVVVGMAGGHSAVGLPAILAQTEHLERVVSEPSLLAQRDADALVVQPGNLLLNHDADPREVLGQQDGKHRFC